MSIKETFPQPSRGLFAYHLPMFNKNKDGQAMNRFTILGDSMVNFKDSGRYAEGSWGYTATNRSDKSVNEELGRRFILEECNIEKLNIPNLDKASQDDIKALTKVFDAWLYSAAGDVDEEFNIQHSARFCDFLAIDEASLRSLAALPKETPPLGLVSREERRARDILYCYSYVWLVDSQAVKRFQGVENGGHYDGWMKLCTEDIYDAWFERTNARGTWRYIFERMDIPKVPGKLWYRAH
ncbi:hypothetical protein ACLOAV_002332 [Pseudogymnoascus australis]